jgi:hypothetical protein
MTFGSEWKRRTPMTGRELLIKTLMESGVSREVAENAIKSIPQPEHIDDDFGTEEEIEAKLAKLKLTLPTAAQAIYDKAYRKDKTDEKKSTR